MADQGDIYIVTQGEYSDYRIVAVFTEEADAVKFVETYKNGERRWYSDEPEIETWPTNPYTSEQLRLGLMRYEAFIDKDGNNARAHRSETQGAVVDPKHEHFVRVNFHDVETLNTVVYATCEKHAIKIANERRASLLANNLWDCLGKSVIRRKKSGQGFENKWIDGVLPTFESEEG